MKILLIHNKYKDKGGEDFVVLAEQKLLKQKGHDVFLFEFDNKIIKSKIGSLKTGITSFYNLSSSKVLNSKIDYYKPDIIHVHNIFYIASPSIFYVAKRRNIPIVMTLHNYRLICAGALLLRKNHVCELCINKVFPISGVKYGCHRNSKIQSMQLIAMTGLHKLIGTWKNTISKYILLTEFGKLKVLNSSLGLKEDQIIVKANSVQDKGFATQKGRSENFLFIGRLSEEKGIRVLLESIKYFQYSLTIVGDGPLKELVIEYSKKHQSINYLGFLSKTSVLEMLKTSKALIFPSTWYEGMPLTILESFSTGTPIICSNMPNLNQIVIDEYNGILFSPGSSSSLAETVKRFHFNTFPHLYLNARKSYEDYYSEEINYTKLINIYRRLIN